MWWCVNRETNGKTADHLETHPPTVPCVKTVPLSKWLAGKSGCGGHHLGFLERRILGSCLERRHAVDKGTRKPGWQSPAREVSSFSRSRTCHGRSTALCFSRACGICVPKGKISRLLNSLFWRQFPFKPIFGFVSTWSDTPQNDCFSFGFHCTPPCLKGGLRIRHPHYH